ncbi:MAG: hypothetical protein K0S32_752 [Bacteroidetes bacterium]|jgi:hypothetical protein|nr:hypothetical protein [Bacteroidota bacterium]
MKKLAFLLVTFFCSEIINAQAIRISVNEKTKEGIKPIAETKFEITMNDTIKTEMTSGSDGTLGKFPLGKGKYNVVLFNPDFINAESKDVIVEERRTNSITITCTRISSLSPEEKKKAGIK